MDSKLLDALAANRRERIDAEVATRAEIAAEYGLDSSKPKEATFQIVVPMGGPSDFNDFSKTKILATSVRDGEAKFSSTSDEASKFLPALTEKLLTETRAFAVSATMPPDVAVSTADEEATLGGGYRYRVPIAAPVSLTVLDGTTGKVLSGPSVDQIVVAQFGPIGALPSKFKGKGGRVMMTPWPDSGGLHSVAIGADALPTTGVTGLLDTATSQLAARRDRTAAAATAAAQVDPELDALTRQQKILALQKQIKELEDSLKK